MSKYLIALILLSSTVFAESILTYPYELNLADTSKDSIIFQHHGKNTFEFKENGEVWYKAKKIAVDKELILLLKEFLYGACNGKEEVTE